MHACARMVDVSARPHGRGAESVYVRVEKFVAIDARAYVYYIELVAFGFGADLQLFSFKFVGRRHS